MANFSKLCFGCMHEMPDGVTECPICKFDNNSQNDSRFLPIRTVLSQRYVVGKVLSVNGEGVTYLGFDRDSDMAVRIREYFPVNLCERDGLNVVAISEYATSYESELSEFLSLARNLARMRSLSALLPVYDIFEDNNTAYYISETVEAITLRDFLIRNGGSLSFEQLRPLFMPIMQTLISLHQVGIVHRGISPDTLIIGKDGKIRLTEFCVAAARTARTDMTAQLFKGYAAIEQYGIEDEQGSWTDVYALAATMYRALVGSPPPEATARVTNDKMIIPASVADKLSSYVMSGLANALQILPNERTESVEIFRDEISASPTVVSRATQRTRDRAETSNQPTRKKRGGRKGLYVIISMLATIVALSLVGTLIYYGLFSKPEVDPNAETTTVETTTEKYSENVIDPNAGTVPNFVGKSYGEITDSSDAEIIRANENYKIEVKSKEYSDKEKGIILSQTPKAGTAINKGDKITLVISLGSREFSMPDIVGLTKDKAHIELLKAGFLDENIKWIEKSYSNKKYDTVISVTPEEGDKVNSDMRVEVAYNVYQETTTDSAEQFNYRNDELSDE